jgi:hypothetical protein
MKNEEVISAQHLLTNLLKFGEKKSIQILVFNRTGIEFIQHCD